MLADMATKVDYARLLCFRDAKIPQIVEGTNQIQLLVLSVLLPSN